MPIQISRPSDGEQLLDYFFVSVTCVDHPHLKRPCASIICRRSVGSFIVAAARLVWYSSGLAVDSWTWIIIGIEIGSCGTAFRYPRLNTVSVRIPLGINIFFELVARFFLQILTDLATATIGLLKLSINFEVGSISRSALIRARMDLIILSNRPPVDTSFGIHRRLGYCEIFYFAILQSKHIHPIHQIIPHDPIQVNATVLLNRIAIQPASNLGIVMSLSCIGQANEADQRKEEALGVFHRIGFCEFSGFVGALARENGWFVQLEAEGVRGGLNP